MVMLLVSFAYGLAAFWGLSSAGFTPERTGTGAGAKPGVVQSPVSPS